MSRPDLHKFLWKNIFGSRAEAEKDVLTTISMNRLFQGLSPKQLQYVSKFTHVRNFQNGESVFREDEKGLGMYMIVKGSVEIKIRHPEKHGAELLVTTLEAGSFFGELALIDTDALRTASAYSVGPCELLGFFKPDLMDVTERKPEIGAKIFYQLSRVLGQRLEETTEALIQVATDSPNREHLKELKKAA